MSAGHRFPVHLFKAAADIEGGIVSHHLVGIEQTITIPLAHRLGLGEIQ